MRICIVGAGPAGLLLAQHLMGYYPSQEQQQGNCYYDIHLFDKRPNPLEFEDPTKSSCYPIGIQGRGLNAIKSVASPDLVQKLQQISSPIDTVRFDTTGRGNCQQITRPSTSLMMEQGDLQCALLQHLVDVSSTDNKNKCTLHFDCEIERVWLHNQTMRICDNEQGAAPLKACQELNFDHLVAADGARSKLRDAFAQQDSNFQFTKQKVPGGYKTFFLERQAVNDNPKDADKKNEPVLLDPTCIHGWMSGSQSFLSVPLPHKDYSSGVYAFTQDPDPLDGMTPSEAQAYFRDKLPAMAQFLSEKEIATLLERPAVQLQTVQCNQLTAGTKKEAVLLGDAAHTFSSALNQGCNSALQDVQVLAECLAAKQHDWPPALAVYEEARRDDVAAAHELSSYSLPNTLPQKVEFLGRMLLKKVPFLGPHIPPLPMELVFDETKSYSDILNQCQGWISKVKRSTLRQQKQQQQQQQQQHDHKDKENHDDDSDRGIPTINVGKSKQELWSWKK